MKRPIVIDKGAPEWMVTFGDMMTLLLIFFILLFSVAKLKDAGQVYDMIYALQGNYAGTRPVHGYLLPNYNAMIDDLREEAESEQFHFGERGVHSARVKHSEGNGFYSLRARDHLKIVVEGTALFDEGSPLLLDEGKQTLETLLVPRFRDGPFRIVIRGHAAPGEGATADAEDDLGMERARDVRAFFVSHGIPADRFELQTMGSKGARQAGAAPKANEAAAEPADAAAEREAADVNRRRLRRVDIFVSPQASGPPIESGRR